MCNDAKIFFVIQEEGVKEGVDGLTNIRVGVDNEASSLSRKASLRRNPQLNEMVSVISLPTAYSPTIWSRE